MKANRTIRNDRAEVGVGTLIVFIAMVLVAAVAAAVLINTGGTLQQRAQATGKEATQEVSSNLKVVGVYAYRNDTGSSDDLRVIKVNVELSAGAVPMDLQKLILRYSDGTNTQAYNWSDVNLADDNAADATFFSTQWIRGSGTNDVMESGDLVELKFIVGTDILERTDIKLDLIPETGSPVSADFRTPATYSTDKTVTLR